MKVYIVVDMEGIAGATSWSEMTKTSPEYAQFQNIMTQETIAACKAAHQAGATEVWVRDGHGSGQNILLAELPEYVTTIRAWSGQPQEVLEGLDTSFDHVLFLGWHARAGSEAHPLAHTISGKIAHITINGTLASELHINSYLAAYIGVPVTFISGDSEVCKAATQLNKNITTVQISRGVGASTISRSPKGAITAITQGVTQALQKPPAQCKTLLPESFEVCIKYTTPEYAYKFSWYPGAKHSGERQITFKTKDYFEVVRLLKFVT